MIELAQSGTRVAQLATTFGMTEATIYDRLKQDRTRRLPKGARVAKVTSLDLVRRDFRRDAPDRLWMTDITEHPTREGKVYCCVVLDAFSRLVVGWSIDITQTTSLVLKRARDGDSPAHPPTASW